jgi:hypothetical protein
MELDYEMSNRSRYATRMIYEILGAQTPLEPAANIGSEPFCQTDLQRFSLISCVFGLNSFLNLDRSVKQ